ncbi:MAG: hypothetical protein AAGA91_09550 [Pseudomonadota bacterium]
MKSMTGHSLSALLAGILLLGAADALQADDKAMIDANTERAIHWLKNSGGDAGELLERAHGVLIMPDLVQMKFGAGGEFGEGALLVDGETVDYYASAGKAFGVPEETEFKAEVIFFLSEEALETFRSRTSWKAGEFEPVTVIAGDSPEALKAAKSKGMVGVVFTEDGYLSGKGLKGDRLTRIVR